MRYVLMEHINNGTDDSPVLGAENFDEKTKDEITRQYAATVLAMRSVTGSHFGSISDSGLLGRHKTYDGYYHSTLDLLIEDGEALGIFTDEESDVVKQAAAKPLVYNKKYTPTFVHGDIGTHNMIWGNIDGGDKKLYVFDFGNAYYGLPFYEERITKIHGDDVDILEKMDLDRNLYENNLIEKFERMFWNVTERCTEDYAYCRDWMISIIEAAKKDASRTHITNFVDTCRGML